MAHIAGAAKRRTRKPSAGQQFVEESVVPGANGKQSVHGAGAGDMCSVGRIQGRDLFDVACVPGVNQLIRHILGRFGRQLAPGILRDSLPEVGKTVARFIPTVKIGGRDFQLLHLIQEFFDVRRGRPPGTGPVRRAGRQHRPVRGHSLKLLDAAGQLGGRVMSLLPVHLRHIDVALVQKFLPGKLWMVGRIPVGA